MLTLITPTNNIKFLGRLAASIDAQTDKNFEWVIVPNGDVSPESVKAVAPSARVVPYYGKTNNIGELKRFCCEQAKGDAYVEVDHDDELMPNCVARLAAEFVRGADFVYSNCATIKDGAPVQYSSEFGWEYRPILLPNRTPALECLAFDPSPASFSRIWYAPNHVRAWDADFYWKIGGHNPELAVLDDQDLMCRSYINGRCVHIDECLYIYHVHGENSWLGEKNKFIQTETLNLHDKYIYGLAERWADLSGLMKIDLCGGHGKPEGYKSVDLKNADILIDLDYSWWELKDNSVGVLRAHDALEHLKDPIKTMQEAQRVLAPGGWFLTLTPSTDGRGAFQDPTHVSFWNRNSFFYYTREQQAKYIGYPVVFQETRIKDFFPTPWHAENNCPYVKADLLKPFEGRTPGGVFKVPSKTG